MIPEWAARYEGIPWLDGGRDREGCDCYGLMRLVMLEQFGVDLPSYAGAYTSAQEQREVSTLLETGIAATGWKLVAAKSQAPLRAGDGVVIRIEGQPWHVGVMVDDDNFLHVMKGMAYAVVDRISSYRWERRVVGVYRHEAVTV